MQIQRRVLRRVDIYALHISANLIPNWVTESYAQAGVVMVKKHDGEELTDDQENTLIETGVKLLKRWGVTDTGEIRKTVIERGPNNNVNSGAEVYYYRRRDGALELDPFREENRDYVACYYDGSGGYSKSLMVLPTRFILKEV